MNGQSTPPEAGRGDMVDVKVDVRESVGVIVLGFMVFILLLAFLRSQRRERQLLERLGELQAELNQD